jgi:hypothetical protein
MTISLDSAESIRDNQPFAGFLGEPALGMTKEGVRA